MSNKIKLCTAPPHWITCGAYNEGKCSSPIGVCEKGELHPVMKVVRTAFPSSVKGEIFSEMPMAEPKKIEREKILVIQVFDPRKIIDGNDNITEVLIQLVEQDIPKEKQNGFYLVPTRVIETLRRYSFEEWDSLIEGKRVRFGNFEPS